MADKFIGPFERIVLPGVIFRRARRRRKSQSDLLRTSICEPEP